MVDFDKALLKTLRYEGKYVNDKDDPGGETYKGISRRYHPDWHGWHYIDKAKKNTRSRFPQSLETIRRLQTEVAQLYRQLYWNRFWGDKIPQQRLVEKLFDTSVNLGVKQAVMYLQEGLNLLNRNQKNYDDIVMDGLFGRQTLKVLDIYLKQNSYTHLLKIMSILQGMHYIKTMRRSPVQEKYARGWLKRV